MNTLRALLLSPIAFAGVFTAIPFAEAAMVPRTWQDVLIMAAMLAPAYAYLIGAVVWISRWDAGQRFLGLSKIGWLIPISAAYGVGVGCVVLAAML